MSIKDGGPAFPLENAGTEFQTGMTLRDWLAGQAPPMPEYWSAPKEKLLPITQPEWRGPDFVAEWETRDDALKHNAVMHEVTWRWAYADAMIAAREAAQ